VAESNRRPGLSCTVQYTSYIKNVQLITSYTFDKGNICLCR